MITRLQVTLLALTLLWLVPGTLIAAEHDYTIQRAEAERFADLGEAWQAPNAHQGFDAYFVRDGVRIEPRGDVELTWAVDLTLLRYGREGTLAAAVLLEPPFPNGNRIEFDRGNLIEWFVNDPEGIEQGFDIAERPSGPEGSGLILELGIRTDLLPVFSTDGQAVEFHSSDGGLVLRYSKLVVTDALGDRFPSRMEGFAAAGERGIRLVVDDRDAVYPLRIDPLMTTASWIRYGSAPNEQYGSWVAAAGDVNGDGYGDVLVGADRYDNGETNEGHAELFLGTPSGLAPTAAWEVEANEASAFLGKPVAAAGDINGDGYADIAVACLFCDAGGSNRGAVYVYFGSPTGPSLTADIVLTGTVDSENFGYSVSTAGDFNGDGFSDLIVGSRDIPGGYAGKATLFTGSAGGLSLLATFVGDEPSRELGFSVAGGGDFNNDGYDDVVVGAPGSSQSGPNSGEVHVWLGAASGVGSHLTYMVPGSLSSGARMGRAVAFLGDTDGDGTSDFAVGAEGHDQFIGAVVIFRGPAGGFSVVEPNVSLDPFAYFGVTVASAGDVNDDGYADLLVGSDSYGPSNSIKGAAYVFAGPFGPGPYSAAPVWTKIGELEDVFGTRVAATDVNGDGLPDMIVSAIGDDLTPDGTEGSVSVFHSGTPEGLGSDPGIRFEQGGPFGSTFPKNAGDVNGDGFEDAVLGQPLYAEASAPGGRVLLYHGGFGGLPATPDWISDSNTADDFYGNAAGAGDVNGDGFDDVVIGARGYDGAVMDGGRIELFYGAPTGLGGSPDWFVEGSVSGSQLGWETVGLGDVNGDGFADIAVGAPAWSSGQTNEGAVYVYLGSATGLAPTYDWFYESNNAGAWFGAEIDAAGDVNGDGYSDMIVGAELFSSGESAEGAAFVFFGGPSGFGPAPDWAFQANEIDAKLGFAVGGVGDLNGDGYADVAAGSVRYNVDSGRVWVFLGGPAGPSLTADWVLDDPTVSSPHLFGASVDTIGDVNGDGFSDMAVGCVFCDPPMISGNQGAVFVYHGSALGISGSDDWRTYGAAQISLGRSVDGADVNGDGLSDLMVGTQTHEFQLFLSRDTGPNPVERLPRLRRGDDSAPIPHLGASNSPSFARVLLEPSTVFGPGNVALEVEVKPLGVPFDGMNTHLLPFRDNSAPPVSELITGLTDGTLYRWRTRTVYDPVTRPFFPRGPWITNGHNGWTESDFRTAGNATASAVPDGNMVSGTPLTVRMDDSIPGFPQIVLDWGESCGGEATDYAIYIGTIGDFTSHVPCTCSTSGQTIFGYPPDPVHSQYYLVVPVNTAGQREGSYGVDSGGTARPASLAACYPTGAPATCNP